MIDRWKFDTEEKDGQTLLRATPLQVPMAEFVSRATRELAEKIANAEEHFIIQAMPQDALERLLLIVQKEIQRRKLS